MNCDEKKELDRLKEVRTASEDIFDGVILHVKKDTVRLPNGNSAVREVIRHIGAVCVIPVTDDKKVIMERQFRYPLNRIILEIPAGKLDAPDENRLSAIRRELREETGICAEPGEFELFCTDRDKTAFYDFYCLKKEVSLEEIVLQPGETDAVKWVTFAEIHKMIERGEVCKIIAHQFLHQEKYLQNK